MTLRFYHWVLAIASTILLLSGFAYMFFYNHPPRVAAAPEAGGIEISMSMIAAGTDEGSRRQETISETSAIKEEGKGEVLSAEETSTPQEPRSPTQSQDVASTVIDTPLPEPSAQKADPPPKPPPPEETKTPPGQPQKAVGRDAINTTSQAHRDHRQPQSGSLQKVERIDPNYKDILHYGNRLRYWLEKHKTYPSLAKRRRREGMVIIAFVVNRRGKVLNSEIVKSSGHKVLDRETLKMLKRAQPLPPFPKKIESEKLEFSIPIHFFLR